MIASQDSGHRTLVAEVGGHAVGFISVTTDVDVALLEEGFSLEAFHGLRASCEEDGSVSTSQESECGWVGVEGVWSVCPAMQAVVWGQRSVWYRVL